MKRAVVFKLAKGFTQRGKNNYRITANRVDHALMYAYRDRRTKKRTNRAGWITQINAATRQLGLPYSQFIDAVQQSNIALNRKMLAELAVTEPFSFQALANEVSKIQGIKWRNTHANRLTKADYAKYEPPTFPPGFEMAPNQSELNFKLAFQELEPAEKKAAQINADLIKSGKVVLKKPTLRKLDRPRKNPPASAPATIAADKKAPPAAEKKAKA